MKLLLFAILAIFLFWALKSFARASSKKIANRIRSIIVIVPIIIAAIFVFLGKFLFSLPFLILILPLLKIKGGLSIWQMLYLWRTLQTLKASGRFRFGQSRTAQSSSMSVTEAYKILNLDPKKKYTKDEVQKQWKRVISRVHPDISPETARLASIVNEARDIILKSL
mgnify:CR=1 FL=1